MDPLRTKYHLPAPDIAWVPSIAAGAGIYLLEDRCHFAPFHSPAEHRLIAAGAVFVGSLRFDPDPRERSHPGRPVRPLALRESGARFSSTAERN